MKVFVQMAQHYSLAAAACQPRMATAPASKRVAAFEGRGGARFFFTRATSTGQPRTS
jgi:DNA-binding transcriptional LysR family regulator